MHEGLVFHDEDGDGQRTGREKGLARVPVSNGLDVVLTDVRGRYLIPDRGPRAAFVIAPRGWRQAPCDQAEDFALKRWPIDSPPSVHIGATVAGAPAAHATVGFDDAMAPRPGEAPGGTLPTAFNVGDLHVIVVNDTLPIKDTCTFIEADLHHAGAARPVLLVTSSEQEPLRSLLENRPFTIAVDTLGGPSLAAVLGHGDQIELIAEPYAP